MTVLNGWSSEMWWACLDSNQGHVLPMLESILPGYADSMLQELREGHLDDLTRMLELLKSLGGLER